MDNVRIYQNNVIFGNKCIDYTEYQPITHIGIILLRIQSGDFSSECSSPNDKLSIHLAEKGYIVYQFKFPDENHESTLINLRHVINIVRHWNTSAILGLFGCNSGGFYSLLLSSNTQIDFFVAINPIFDPHRRFMMADKFFADSLGIKTMQFKHFGSITAMRRASDSIAQNIKYNRKGVILFAKDMIDVEPNIYLRFKLELINLENVSVFETYSNKINYCDPSPGFIHTLDTSVQTKYIDRPRCM